MSIWMIIKNAGFLISFFRNMGEVVKTFSETKKFGCADSHRVLEQVEELIRKKIIDVEGVDEDQIADAIKSIREQWKCKI